MVRKQEPPAGKAQPIAGVSAPEVTFSKRWKVVLQNGREYTIHTDGQTLTLSRSSMTGWVSYSASKTHYIERLQCARADLPLLIDALTQAM